MYVRLTLEEPQARLLLKQMDLLISQSHVDNYERIEATQIKFLIERSIDASNDASRRYER